MVFLPEKMTRVRMIAAQESVRLIVKALYEFGAIHITQSKNGVPDAPSSEFEKVSEKLVALRAIEKQLDLPEVEKATAGGLDELVHEAGKVLLAYESVVKAASEASEARSKKQQLEEKARELLPFKGFVFHSLKGTQSVEVACFDSGDRKLFSLAVAGFACEHVFSADGKKVLVACDRRKGGELRAALHKAGFHEARIPVLERGAVEELDAIAKEIRATDERIATAQKKEDAFRKEHGSRAVALLKGLEVYGKLASLPSRFGKTDFLEVVEGWVPSRRFNELKRKTESLENPVFLESVETREPAPTKLRNPPGARRFEFLVEFFSLPRCNEIDPTLLMAVTFPILFGMILGDMGYGFVALLIALVLKFKVKMEFMQSVAGMMMLSAIATIFFGWVYGEIFGAEEFAGMVFHPFIERSSEGIALLIVASVAAGIIHLTLGLLLGMANGLRHRDWNHVIAKLAWIGVEFGFLGIGAGLVGGDALPIAGTTLLIGSAVLLIVCAALIAKFESFNAIFELPGMLSNILSYLRIMALGLSGVILAKIVNAIPAESSFESLSHLLAGNGDPIAIVVALLMFLAFAGLMVAGHAAALLLGLFESSIQTLRLHYVEFFSKFYHGGGTAFVPLRSKPRGV